MQTYFNFHYGLGCVLGLAVFSGYLLTKKKGISVKEVICGLTLSVYLVFLLGGTLLNREVGEEHMAEWIPFWSYAKVLTEWNESLAIQMVYNVLAFIPFGILMPTCFQHLQRFRYVICGAVILSGTIEVLQLLFKFGLFEFDDIFHNTLGASLGYGVWHMFMQRIRRRNEKRMVLSHG